MNVVQGTIFALVTFLLVWGAVSSFMAGGIGGIFWGLQFIGLTAVLAAFTFSSLQPDRPIRLKKGR